MVYAHLFADLRCAVNDVLRCADDERGVVFVVPAKGGKKYWVSLRVIFGNKGFVAFFVEEERKKGERKSR